MFAVLMVMGCKANVNTGTQSFAVAFSAVGGTVSAKVDGKEITNGALIARGKTVTFTAHPQSGMKVSHWTGIENAGDKVTVSLTVNAAVSVTAECTAIMHTVAFTQPEHGTLKATVGGKSIAAGAPVEKGKTVVFIAEAADRYNVDGWTLDGTAVNGTNAVYVLPVTKAVEVKVNFTAASAAVSQFPILFANPEHGTLEAQKADNTNFVSGGEV